MTGRGWQALAGLPLSIEEWRTERRSVDVSTGFTRVTTTVVLAGGEALGEGEDVCYDPADHERFPTGLELSGDWTLEGFSRRLDGLELFPARAAGPSERDHRRWAFESAALDLALRQAGLSLGHALDREYAPVRFVVSTRLDIETWLAVDPGLEFKLDPTSEWSAVRMREIAATGRVRVLDFKGHYVGTPVDQPPDARLYGEAAVIFPDAILEDPAWTPETAAALAGHEARIAWDAPVHSAADLDRLPIEPRRLNVKPSRFGSVRGLFECLDACAEREIACYGGGQFELGPGRGQIQALASLLYPDAPNDVAPGVYNGPRARPGLPSSPLPPPERPLGFSFRSAAPARSGPPTPN